MLTRPDMTLVGLRPLDELLPRAPKQDTGPLPPGVAMGGWTPTAGFVAAQNWPVPMPPQQEDS
jgi:hypothetical protein